MALTKTPLAFICLLFAHAFSAVIGWIDRVCDRIIARDLEFPASVGEVGCDPEGSWCTGRPTGDTAPVFVTPVKSIYRIPLDQLEEMASRPLGPNDPRLTGRAGGRARFTCSHGTGLAGYAEVPCTNPQCAARRLPPARLQG